MLQLKNVSGTNMNIFTMSELFDGRVILMKIWHLSNVQMLSRRNRLRKKQMLQIRNALSEIMISHFEFCSQREYRLFFGICLPASILNFKGRVGNFFSLTKCKISKFFDTALHYKDFFQSMDFDSDQIFKQIFNEVVKLFMPRKVTKRKTKTK